MTRPLTRLARAVAVALTGTVVLSGCDFDVYSLPLPGGTDVGDDAMTVTVQFEDVLDLVPQSSVKVDQVTVGSVEKIELNGWTARVTLRLPKNVDLPDNAVAELKQTSLLGEKYVQLSAPAATAPEGHLGDGDNIPLARTGRNPEVEEVLSALSLLLNGGGVAQLKTIETELNNAMRGNQAEIKDVIKQLDIFVGGLDDQKAEIVRAIDNIDKLAGKLAAQKDDIAAALEALPAGLKVLADQRTQLVQMLQALSRLGAVGTQVIQQSKADTAANLKALAPILSELTKAGDNLPKSLQLLLTYPFSDATTGAMKGDFTNMSADLDLNLQNLAGNLGVPTTPPGGGLPTSTPTLPIPTLPLPTVPPLPGLPTGTSTTRSCPPIIGCPLGAPAEQSGSSDGDQSWRSLYYGGAA
jgi:phospholipid/cholesterol/gamma-HCH transport system substrate-binding protein